ncbi:MAG: sigma-70 family RNA polymerase sigma factor [Planctomycetes bacterium]|nr:sigma-70 family RNA polymerase sigma factor [Planctomycetota bacterium]
MEGPSEVTRLLDAIGRGEDGASARLLELVYGELRALAGAYGRGQRPGHTLQPTALVHEAFVKLVEADAREFTDRAHFLAVAATAMRHILSDHARARRADKRGGGLERVTLVEGALAGEARDLDLVALDDALQELSELDARKHRVVELRFFGGLTAEEAARVLDVSLSTVESDWRAARAWLHVRLR